MKTYLKQYGVRMAIIIVVAALLIGLAARPKADGSSGAVPEIDSKISACGGLA